jgi:hypothetical protein
MTEVTTGDGLASNMVACCDILALFFLYLFPVPSRIHSTRRISLYFNLIATYCMSTDLFGLF